MGFSGEYKKYKATFHASPPSGATLASPERQMGSLAGGQQAAG